VRRGHLHARPGDGDAEHDVLHARLHRLVLRLGGAHGVRSPVLLRAHVRFPSGEVSFREVVE